MGKLIVTEFVTLDGVAQAPGGPDEDGSGGFAHGGWQAPLMDQEGDNIFEQAKSMDALLLGRRTYEIFANYWPTAPEEIPFTGLLNGVPKYVASRTIAGPLDWRGSTVLGESIADGDRAHRAAADRIGHLSQWRAGAHLRHRRNAHIRRYEFVGTDERMKPTRPKH